MAKHPSLAHLSSSQCHEVLLADYDSHVAAIASPYVYGMTGSFHKPTKDGSQAIMPWCVIQNSTDARDWYVIKATK